jgi:hypothetical protein
MPDGDIGFPGRMVVTTLLTLLAVEFLLGIGINLYTLTLPSSYGAIFSGNGPQSYPLLVAHVVLGYLLGLLGLILTALLFRKGSRFQLTLSGLGLIGIIIAGVAGEQFVVGGGAPAWSFLMAAAFLWSFVMFFYLESKSRPSRAVPARTTVPAG